MKVEVDISEELAAAFETLMKLDPANGTDVEAFIKKQIGVFCQTTKTLIDMMSTMSK